MDRLNSERVFHDGQAKQRRAYFTDHPDSLGFKEEWYLGHESWIRPAFALLGNLSGKRVLDLGCGHGLASVYLARKGAVVTALELSTGYLEEAVARARFNEVSEQIDFVHASAEELPFLNASFDRIWGNAILHHLDIAKTGREIARVLKPHGQAVFCEPWGENSLLEWGRRYLPYPHKSRSADERPLRTRDLQLLTPFFVSVEAMPFQFLGMVRRIWGSSPVSQTRIGSHFDRALEKGDAALLARFPQLRNLCRYVVLRLTRRGCYNARIGT